MTDIVYIIGTGSAWDDNELRYSLRSIERHAHNLGKVVIVGHCPGFIRADSVLHIPAGDQFLKTKNIMYKVLTAAWDRRVSDEFLFFCDDYILFDSFDVSTFQGRIENSTIPEMLDYMKSKNRTGWWWYKVMTATLAQLRERHLAENNYGVHVPLRIHSRDFVNAVGQFDFEGDPGIEVFTAYGNYTGLPLARSRDNKFTSPDDALKYITESEQNQYPPNFSLKPEVNPEMRAFLKGMFPRPSIFEK